MISKAKLLINMQMKNSTRCSFFCTFQMGLVVKNPPANAGNVRDAGSSPGSGRAPGGVRGSPIQYSFLENPMDRGAWWAIVRRFAYSRT